MLMSTRTLHFAPEFPVLVKHIKEAAEEAGKLVRWDFLNEHNKQDLQGTCW